MSTPKHPTHPHLDGSTWFDAPPVRPLVPSANTLRAPKTGSLANKPHQIPDVCLDHLVRVFCGEGGDLKPEDFTHVAVLVRHEASRRARAKRSGAVGARINNSNSRKQPKQVR